MNAPFVVPIAELRRQIGKRMQVTRSGQIEDLACSGSEVPQGAECEADVVLESVLGGVSVEGAVTAPWVGECRRCLAPAAGRLRIRVRELYTPGGDSEETYPLVGTDLDLEPLVRDAVLLDLPQALLCRDDCAGLCPLCGADRNERACGCEPQRDPRWEGLDSLLETGVEGPPRSN